MKRMILPLLTVLLISITASAAENTLAAANGAIKARAAAITERSSVETVHLNFQSILDAAEQRWYGYELEGFQVDPIVWNQLQHGFEGGAQHSLNASKSALTATNIGHLATGDDEFNAGENQVDFLLNNGIENGWDDATNFFYAATAAFNSAKAAYESQYTDATQDVVLFSDLEMEIEFEYQMWLFGY